MARGGLGILALLEPGLRLKRWLVLLVLGLVLLSLGLVYLLVEIYRSVPLPEQAGPLTLQFLPRPLRALLFGLSGLLLIVFAIWRFNSTLLSSIRPNSGAGLVESVLRSRSRQRGPRVVVIGGGTGLSTMLRGLKDRTDNITAIVTVADDGGSSGRLRRELGILPPGDFRNCIVALADAEPLMSRLFQYRFGPGSGLEGHSFGNLFIVAMSGITGNFEEAIRESSRVLAVRGQILPSTLENVTLCAEMADAQLIQGESSISASSARIRRVFLEPRRPPAYPEAVKAILEADLIVVGPGSLYTSILPNLVVDGIARSVAASEGLKVFVCNVATQPGETDGFGVREHFEALLAHLPGNPFAVVLTNNSPAPESAPGSHAASSPVRPFEGDELHGSIVVQADVVDERAPLRHDPEKLAAALLSLYTANGAAGSGDRERVGAVV